MRIFRTFQSPHVPRTVNKMYILVKEVGHTDLVWEVLQMHGVRIIESFKVFVPDAVARVVYRTMEGSRFYEDAVSSLADRTVHVFVIDAGDMSYADFKRNVQGPFGTADANTIRGYLSDEGRIPGSFVHVPDDDNKSLEDRSAFVNLCEVDE